jgi:ketosteroid isomerase-like protein
MGLQGTSHCLMADRRILELGMGPRQVVELWVERFNAGDADGLASLYAEDAVNHQVVREPVAGRGAIRDMFATEFAAAPMHCIVEAIHEAGEVVALEWRDPAGVRGCGFFTVRGGTIVFQRGYWDRQSFAEAHGAR